MSLLCTTRFDPSLEAFEWNNAPDGTPSPYLLLSFQLDRLLSAAHHPRINYTALRNICDDAVRNTDAKTPLKVIASTVRRQALTLSPDTHRLPALWEHHRVRIPSSAIAV